jgi:hypothetical protein
MATQHDANQGVTHTEGGTHVLHYILRIHALSSNAIFRYAAKFFGKGNTDLSMPPARVYCFHLLVLSLTLTQDDNTCNDRLTGVGILYIECTQPCMKLQMQLTLILPTVQ